MVKKHDQKHDQKTWSKTWWTWWFSYRKLQKPIIMVSYILCLHTLSTYFVYILYLLNLHMFKKKQKQLKTTMMFFHDVWFFHDVCIPWCMYTMMYVYHDVCMPWCMYTMMYVYHDVCKTWYSCIPCIRWKSISRFFPFWGGAHGSLKLIKLSYFSLYLYLSFASVKNLGLGQMKTDLEIFFHYGEGHMKASNWSNWSTFPLIFI